MPLPNPYANMRGLMIGAGIGEAFSKGMEAFMKAREMRNQEERDKMQLGLLAARENMEVDPNTGLLGLTPYGQQLRDVKLEGDRADIEYKRAQAEFLRRNKGKGPATSLGQQALDREYGKGYAKRTLEGGYSDALKGLSQIDDATKELSETDSATGGLVGLLPKKVRDYVTPKGAAIQDTVEEVVQRNLRQVLGAQFTEKEGQRLIARAYNPRLSEAENVRRLNRLKTQMQQAIELQQGADEYFDEHGTLQGFKGKLYQSAEDFKFDDAPAQQGLMGGDGFTDQKRQRLDELRKKKSQGLLR